MFFNGWSNVRDDKSCHCIRDTYLQNILGQCATAFGSIFPLNPSTMIDTRAAVQRPHHERNLPGSPSYLGGVKVVIAHTGPRSTKRRSKLRHAWKRIFKSHNAKMFLGSGAGRGCVKRGSDRMRIVVLAYSCWRLAAGEDQGV